MSFQAYNIFSQKLTGIAARIALKRPADRTAADPVLLQMLLGFKGVKPLPGCVEFTFCPVDGQLVQPRLDHALEIVQSQSRPEPLLVGWPRVVLAQLMRIMPAALVS